MTGKIGKIAATIAKMAGKIAKMPKTKSAPSPTSKAYIMAKMADKIVEMVGKMLKTHL